MEDPCTSMVVVDDRDMEIDSAEEEEEGGGEEEYDEDIRDGDYNAKFDAEMNPMDFVNNDPLYVQPFLEDDHPKYETLAEQKRKALLDDQGEPSRKKLRQEDENGAQMFQNLMESMVYGRRRRKSKDIKKKGRRKGSSNKLSPEITRKLGNATLHYAQGRYAEAVVLLNEVILVAPHLSDPFHTLGLVYKALGENIKAFNCYMFAAYLSPKDSSLWTMLATWSTELGNKSLAMYCLSKAISTNPDDITLRFHYASLFVEAGNYQKGAECYEKIIKICPDDAEAYKLAAKLHWICGQGERSINILEDYIKGHVNEADLSVVDECASMCMKSGEHSRAIKYIEQAQSLHRPGEDFPLHLTIKAGICHVHLGDMENAKTIFRVLKLDNVSDHVDLVTEVAESYIAVSHYECALTYYLKLQENAGPDDGALHLKIAQCYSSLNERVQAIEFYKKGLYTLPNNVEARLSLASLLVEDDKVDEVISLLSPPTNAESAVETYSDKSSAPWWLNWKVKLMLSDIYRAKGMTKEFVDAIFSLIRESLYIESINQKIKAKKRLPNSVLQERAKVLQNFQTDNVFQVRPIGKNIELSKASRAKKLLEKRENLKGEKKAAALAAGLDWHSDDSDDDFPREVKRVPPLPKFLNNEKHHLLIIELCKALASLQRYWEAIQIINLTLRLAHKLLSAETKEELQCLGAQTEYNITDSRHGYDYLRYIIQQRPHSIAAWNCYYKAIAGSDNQCSKHSKFLRVSRNQHKDCIPPIIISGHQHSSDSRHQAAAKDYLLAYKLLPENPLINLSVGTALINLALDFRLSNKHICVAQGLSFLYNNLRLCGNTQEALYNIARAYHHVGLFSLAASHYEKVLAITQKDHPIPELTTENTSFSTSLTPGYCNIRREAAYNLHLIYKNSGAVDLARQVLKDHCYL